MTNDTAAMTINIYHKALLRHAAEARAHGRLDSPDASVTIDNPLCGDRVTIEIKTGDGRIKAIAQEVRACVLCQASASIIGAGATGATATEIEALSAAVSRMLEHGEAAPDGRWAAYSAFEPVREFKSRHRCVLLPFEALIKAFAEAGGNQGDGIGPKS